ncbi:hypothetical protein PHMEG_00011905 [Phytophthora megakarya]|uniref:Chromo domain-containing protein n=1 Tax=Phytophthora megakarya TaxID=4795 RepID=A0A225WAE4_9STRA|nr:hypothetical protein PHMEG_00011905 [Phytophthora megakarya]
MAYRPQANGTAERMVQTATRVLKMYVRDLDQKNWDEYAERFTFAINTAHDRIRGDTPIIWCMGGIRHRRWRLHFQSDAPDGAIVTRGGGVIREGYARKLAHLWHGTFRVAEKINEFTLKLEIAGTGYQIFPVVHISKLKLVKDFQDRPRVELTVSESDRLDFDEILLPEDSWVPDLGAGEYEVERISDVRSGKKTRFGRIYREFLVHWAGYDEPTRVDEADLNSGAILIAFLRERVNRNRFNVMQSYEEIWRSAIPSSLPSQKFQANNLEIIVQLGGSSSLGEEVQADLIAFINRLISPLEGRVAIDISPISIFSDLGDLREGSISIGVGESGDRFGSRVVGLALQTADLLRQVPNLVPGLGSLQTQTIAICLSMMKLFTGGNRMTLEIVGDLVSLPVLERFHVSDVGSELADLQIKMISIPDEAIPREIQDLRTGMFSFLQQLSDLRRQICDSPFEGVNVGGGWLRIIDDLSARVKRNLKRIPIRPETVDRLLHEGDHSILLLDVVPKVV